jgi:hypothetical protein
MQNQLVPANKARARRKTTQGTLGCVNTVTQPEKSIMDLILNSHPNSPSTNWFTNHQTIDKFMSTLFLNSKSYWLFQQKGISQRAVVHPQQANKRRELPEQPRVAAEATSTIQNSQTTKSSTIIITQKGSNGARVTNK